MGCKIYSDVRGNCPCGGSFTKYQIIKNRSGDLKYPICDLCGVTPSRFRVLAKIKDNFGKQKYVFLRKNLAGEPLTDIQDVFALTSKVHTDQAIGKFNYSEYDKKVVKEGQYFKNIVVEYLNFQGPRVLRKEISPYSLESKKKYSKKLSDYFGEIPIFDINGPSIEIYKNTLVNHSDQVMCLGELKTILNWAKRLGKISSVPSIEVPANKKRKSVPNLMVARDRIIPAIENEVHRAAIQCLEYYGIRPSEVRAIQYEQIDLANDRIIIDRHFSKTTLLMGRKSASEGEDTSTLDRPLSPELKAYLKSRPWPLDKKAFVFQNSVGKALGVKDLSQTWRETLKKLKLPHVELYGLRGAKITEVLKKTDKNYMKARDFAGHADIRTTMKHYDHSDRNVDDVFKKES